jgi:multidrug efflux pump subunit AcrA (membrane-fusion protein)
VVHQIIMERREAERQRQEEYQRRAAEQQRLRAEAEARKQAEDQKRRADSEAWKLAELQRLRAEERRQVPVLNQRRVLRQCTMCGRPLGFFDKLTGQLKHGNCHSFKD